MVYGVILIIVFLSFFTLGILNLPWHPSVKPWTGKTVYYINNNGLIEKHLEFWDITVLDAFISTLFPSLNYGALPASKTIILPIQSLE